MATIAKELRPGGVLLLALDKPPANAIDERLLSDLSGAVAEAAADDSVRAVVLAGRGPCFCAGFDFAAPRRDDAVALELYDLYRDAHLALLTLPKPTIAMVGGHAIAGGMVLALACDLRFASDAEFRIGMNEVAVGASFPRAAFEIVRLRLTHAAAAELLLDARLHPSSDAVRLGFAHAAFARDQLEDDVMERARRVASHPRESYAHAKAAFTAEAAERIRAETADEAVRTMSVWITDESRAARKRQREKLLSNPPPSR